MSGYNLPDDWSWRAFNQYYGDDQEPEEPGCPHCGCPPDEVCEIYCDCEDCRRRAERVGL